MLRHVLGNGESVEFFALDNGTVMRLDRFEDGDTKELDKSSAFQGCKYAREVSAGHINLKELYDAIHGRKHITLTDVQTMSIEEFWNRIGV